MMYKLCRYTFKLENIFDTKNTNAKHTIFGFLDEKKKITGCYFP